MRVGIAGPATSARPNVNLARSAPHWLHGRTRAMLLGASSIVLTIGIWQLVATLKLVRTLFLPPPLKVADALGTLMTGGPIYHDLAISGEEFCIGLAISVVIGGLLGIITGWYKAADEFFKPIVIGLNSMPQVAMIPLLILIFGIGVAPKVIVVVLSCATVILLNTAAGVQNVEERLMRMARSFGATDRQAIRTVVLPHLVPFFMTGFRISIGRALIGVVVGEIFASKAGIGNLLISASNNFNMPVMYASVIVITVIGIILTQCAAVLERRMQAWRA